MTSRLSTKRQSVPKAVRNLPKTTLNDILGCLKYSGPAKTLEEMDVGIAEGLEKPTKPRDD